MNKDKFSLVFFITRPLFTGIIYSLILNYTKNDAIIACLLGTILGIGLIYIYNKINLESKLAKIISALFYIFFILLGIIILETFISSFYLVSTPKIIIIIPTILLCMYAGFKSMGTIKRTSFILLFINLLFSMIVLLSLTSYINISNLTPLFSHSTTSIIKASLVFAFLSAGPNILLNEEKIPLSKHILYYVITALFSTLICFFILATLTPNVASIYSFPEYMTLKRVKIFQFIENIENVMASIFYLDYFMLLVLAFKRLYKLINNKIIFNIFIWPFTFIVTYLVVEKYYPVLFIYHNCTLIMIILTMLLIICSFIKKRVPISSERHR